MALINFSFRRSAREFCSDTTAQTAAGIQPIKVTCRIKQIIPEKIFPRNMKDNHGNKMASNVINLSLPVIAKRKFRPHISETFVSEEVLFAFIHSVHFKCRRH